MSRLIKTTDLQSQQTHHVLALDTLDTLEADLEAAFSRTDQIRVDADGLPREAIVQLTEQLPAESYSRIMLEFSPEILTESLMEEMENISSIVVSDGRFNLTLGTGGDHVTEQFRLLSQNMKLRSKTYEMEIIESLLTDASAETKKYQQLKSQYNNLKASANMKHDADLEKRYLNVMDKYKQALERLDKLRKSKLGRMQMAYWNRKGKH